MKRLVILGIVAAATLSVPAARADHCSSSIYLFSYNRTAQPGDAKFYSGAIACLTVGEDANSDLIYPGADTFFVRWILSSQPVGGTLTFAGVSTPLTFAPCAPLFGVISRGGSCFDSQEISFDPALSITGGDAVATVCETATECLSRTHSTIA